MAKTFTIRGEAFQYPENRDSPGWGEEATAWAESVSNVIGGISSPYDILLTTATINNNVTSPAFIQGLTLNVTATRNALIEYSIYRSTNTDELLEIGTIYVLHKKNPLPNGEWEPVITNGGAGGVTITIDSIGRFQYTSTNMSGTNYSGSIKFRGKVFS